MKTNKWAVTPKSIIEKDLKDNIPKFQQDWIHNFEDFIRQNINNSNLLISDISDELGVSERQLFRRVKRLLGHTPHCFVRNIRMNVAREYLEEGTFSTISEVAFAVGYNRADYFSNEFEKIFGNRPKDYLIQFKKKISRPMKVQSDMVFV